MKDREGSGARSEERHRPVVQRPRLLVMRTGQAFSLIELVMVMVIFATVAAIAVPRYSGALTRYRADAVARRITADLNWARSLARQTRQTVVVNFDVSNNQLSIPAAADPDHPANTYSIDFDTEPYRSRIVSANFAGTAQVSFDGFGVPDNAGAVVVGGTEVQRSIVVPADTGKAILQ